MALFLPIVQMTLWNEAGRADGSISTAVETDVNGAEVCMGITRSAFADWFESHPWPPDIPGAQAFYQANFWTPILGDQIGSQALAAELFDFGVTAWWSHGVKILQGLVGTAQDGVMGPKTLAAANAAAGVVANDLVPRFFDGVLAYYRGLSAPWAASCQAEWLSRMKSNAKRLGVVWAPSS